MDSLMKGFHSLWKKKPQRVAVLGNDYCGKTTLLYRLKLDAIVNAIATIGFNVEEIIRNKRAYELWDIGGCDQIKPLWRHYITSDTITLYMHDTISTEDWRQKESIDGLNLLSNIIMDAGSKYLFVVFPKQDLLPPEKKASIIEEYTNTFKQELSKYDGKIVWEILEVPDMSVHLSDLETLMSMFDQMQEVMTNDKTPKPKPRSDDEPIETRKALTDRPSDEILLQMIQDEGLHESEVATFWQQFLTAEVPKWNHRTHLRAGYLVLLDTLQTGFNLSLATDTFLDHLKRLKALKPDRFRNTEHRTMTSFWLHYLAGAIIKFQANSEAEEWPSKSDFQGVLLQSPHLMYSGLWKEHYSKDRMMHWIAKESYRMADLEPLPDFINDQRRQTVEKAQKEPIDTLRLVRFALDTVQTYLNSSQPRGRIVKIALSALQSSSIQQRAKFPNIPPYSETQAYFWIQYVHAALASAQGRSNTSDSPQLFAHLSFESFQLLFEVKPEAWKTYYSLPVWDNILSRGEFRSPDLKPLPNIITAPSDEAVNAALQKQIQQSLFSDLKLPSPELLVLQARLIIDKTKNMSDIDESQVKDHASFLLFAYERIVANRPSSNGALANHASNVITAKFSSYATSFTHKAFWTHQILSVLVEPSPNGRAVENKIYSFEVFILANPHLSNDGFPGTYYSPEVWNSLDAEETFIRPDRRPLPGYLKAGN